MIITELPERAAPPRAANARRSTDLLLIIGLWLVLFVASLFAPPLLDDADATHAAAAQHMTLTGDWVTLHVNGIRYLEKAPLPYWLTAISFRLFGFNTFATHLPQALAVLLLALLGFHWAKHAFNDRTALYTGLATLTSAGVFLFTRIFIPEALLALFLATTLFCFLQSLQPDEAPASEAGAPPFAHLAKGGAEAPTPSPSHLYPYAMWTALALAVLTKGLVALVFFCGTAAIYLTLTSDFRKLARLKPLTGLLLFLGIAAPWHILAGLRNTGGMDGHGFFWFYFINEHVLRFLGRRFPKDYNKLPGYLFWTLHLVWLFPWSLFAPVTALTGWRIWRQRRKPVGPGAGSTLAQDMQYAVNPSSARTTLLLFIFAAIVLVFFSLSTNQEYYTFPGYLPLLVLLCAALSHAEQTSATDPTTRRSITFAHGAFTTIGLAVAAALAYGLWSSRHQAFVPDIGDLLAHRGVGNYTLSMSALFDLTGPSFAALRLPATLAMLAFAVGPAVAWAFRAQRRHLPATMTIAFTSALFLVAAHIALVRFGPMLSSEDLAAKIQELRDDRAVSRDSEVLLYGDQAFGSSIAFYLDEQVSLVDGRSTSMLFGSTFPDAAPVFLSHNDLLAQWGTGPRKLLFVPLERRDEVAQLLGSRQIMLEETSGKALITDRPLDRPDVARGTGHPALLR